jgi:hypothetical protein
MLTRRSAYAYARRRKGATPGGKRSVLPMHGQDIPIGSFKATLRQLGLTGSDPED